MLFDTHAHMDDRAFDCDRDALIASLPALGVGLVMNPGCSLDSSRNAVALANRYPHVYAAVGSHPDAADEVDDGVVDEYRKLCKQSHKIKAIGEIGLDYHYEDIPRHLQQKAFRAQMALAAELDLPVIVHERDAHADGLAIVDEFPTVKGVFHCYSGSLELAKELSSTTNLQSMPTSSQLSTKTLSQQENYAMLQIRHLISVSPKQSVRVLNSITSS